jgi:hypothetical protein
MSDGDAFQKAAGNRGALEELAMMIPGFQGYLKAEHRREADRLHRNYLCKRIDQARAKVREAVEEWTDDNRFANLELGDKTQNVLQKVTSQVQNADQGYSGAFDTVQIDDAALEALYEIDKNMVSYVKEIEAKCEALDTEAEDKDCKKALKAIIKAAGELELAFSKRKDMITGVA